MFMICANCLELDEKVATVAGENEEGYAAEVERNLAVSEGWLFLRELWRWDLR